MMTPGQVTMVADRVAYDLMPDASGETAWETAQLTEGIGNPEDLEPKQFKKITAILAHDYGIRANPVNSLYFRLNGTGPLTDPEVARRYQPRADRPAAGLRVQQDTDDPFAMLAANGSALRAATALPKAAQRLADQVSTGALSESVRDDIVDAMRQRASDVTSPAIAAAMRRMLPSGTTA